MGIAACVVRAPSISGVIFYRNTTRTARTYVRTCVRVYSVHYSSRRIRPNGHLGSWSQLEQNKLRDDDNFAKSLG